VDKYIQGVVAIKPFYTPNGYIGFAREGIQEGDLICVLQDSKVPVVLRKFEDDRYELLSVCFVLGMMDGEVWGLIQQEKLRLQQFSIC
jgi:hypothetical protein